MIIRGYYPASALEVKTTYTRECILMAYPLRNLDLKYSLH